MESFKVDYSHRWKGTPAIPVLENLVNSINLEVCTAVDTVKLNEYEVVFFIYDG